MIETKIQMRFADIDILGHVNNVNQQHYFDLGKCDFYKQVLGLTPFWGSAGLIIVASQTHYIVQTRRDEPIVVYTRVARIGNKSFKIHFKPSENLKYSTLYIILLLKSTICNQ